MSRVASGPSAAVDAVGAVDAVDAASATFEATFEATFATAFAVTSDASEASVTVVAPCRSKTQQRCAFLLTKDRRGMMPVRPAGRRLGGWM